MARILVTDDSLLTRKAILKILASHDFEVQEAVNGSEALQKIKSFTPDCVLLDLLMPVMSGFEVLETLQKEQVDVPVIVLSSDIQETTKAKCKALGMFDFCNKPPKEVELIERINNALGRG